MAPDDDDDDESDPIISSWGTLRLRPTVSRNVRNFGPGNMNMKVSSGSQRYRLI